MINSINLAYYREKDWERFINSIDDRKSMHNTWNEWHRAYLETKINLTLQGFSVNDFVVNLDELEAYCKANGLKNDGKARSQFVANR
jgi:hypothetical protein